LFLRYELKKDGSTALLRPFTSLTHCSQGRISGPEVRSRALQTSPPRVPASAQLGARVGLHRSSTLRAEICGPIKGASGVEKTGIQRPIRYVMKLRKSRISHMVTSFTKYKTATHNDNNPTKIVPETRASSLDVVLSHNHNHRLYVGVVNKKILQVGVEQDLGPAVCRTWGQPGPLIRPISGIRRESTRGKHGKNYGCNTLLRLQIPGDGLANSKPKTIESVLDPE
jgi:hypothetical protein